MNYGDNEDKINRSLGAVIGCHFTVHISRTTEQILDRFFGFINLGTLGITSCTVMCSEKHKSGIIVTIC